MMSSLTKKKACSISFSQPKVAVDVYSSGFRGRSRSSDVLSGT